MARGLYVVIVPTYNEADNVPILTEKLRALEPSPDIVYVDDASPDGTGDVVDRLHEQDSAVRAIHRTGPRGFAVAELEGLRWALDRGYDYICTMDADMSQDPETLPLLLDEVASGRADIAIGSRYVPGGGMEVSWGPIRRMTSTLGNVYIRLMLGTKVRDNTNSFRCYRRGTLAAAPLDGIKSQGYSFLPELLIHLRRAGARVVEVPTIYVERQLGASKISKGIVFEALGRVTSLGLWRLTHPVRRTTGR